jgi:hypothetical protein
MDTNFPKEPYLNYIQQVEKPSSWAPSKTSIKEKLTNLMMKVNAVLGQTSTRMTAVVRLQDRLFWQLPRSEGKDHFIRQSLDTVLSSVEVYKSKKSYDGHIQLERKIGKKTYNFPAPTYEPAKEASNKEPEYRIVNKDLQSFKGVSITLILRSMLNIPIQITTLKLSTKNLATTSKMSSVRNGYGS